MAADKLARYDTQRTAERYKAVYEERLGRKLSDRLERRLYARFLRRLGPCATVLDLPCGAGRLFTLLAAHAPRVVEADWSGAMLALARADEDGAAAGYLRCSALEIPMRARAVDLVVSVRLSHHLVTEAAREQHLCELFRVAGRGVIVSWSSRTALKNRLRELRRRFDGRGPRNTLAREHVRRLARASGFRELAAAPLSRLSSGHVFGLFVRLDR
jgi:ubiquinone/menaquinone biosynthesis C-methylase UbiE